MFIHQATGLRHGNWENSWNGLFLLLPHLGHSSLICRLTVHLQKSFRHKHYWHKKKCVESSPWKQGLTALAPEGGGGDGGFCLLGGGGISFLSAGVSASSAIGSMENYKNIINFNIFRKIYFTCTIQGR